MVLLPQHENAIIAIEKLEEYCLNPNHPTGKNKALVFKSVYGIRQSDAYFLKQCILEEIYNYRAVLNRTDIFGKRYFVDIKIRNLNDSNYIRTCWIIKSNENFPQLTTCYVL